MVNTLQEKYIDKDIQAMMELGFIDSELNFTPSGMRFVCEFVLNANKKALGEATQALLKQYRKRRENCC